MKRADWLTGLRTVMRPRRRRTIEGAPLFSRRGRQASFETLEDRRLLTITVNTLVDELDGSIVDGDVSLRDAIAAAPAGETINFQASLSGGTITLTQGELHIARSLTIDATALASPLTIDAAGNDPTPTSNNGDGSRVFRISDDTAANAVVELRGLTLTGGDVAGNGGAVLSEERLTLRRTTITGNAATGSGGGVWADVDNSAALNVIESTISGNAAGIHGGGVYAHASHSSTTFIYNSTLSSNFAAGDGGGVYARSSSGGATNIKQTTISGNSANWRGGGVFASADSLTTTTINFSTITANTADADANNPVLETGGGVFAGGVGTLRLDHTIVAKNIDPANHSPDVKVSSGTIQATYNLIGTNGGSTLAPATIAQPDANGNIVGGATAIDPGLAPLANNGGPTQTHALLVTSAAVNHGSLSYTPGNSILGVPLDDQRGPTFGRVTFGPGAFRIDIGAFELQDVAVSTLVVDSVADEDDGDASAGHFSIREAVRIAHGLREEPTIKFDPALSGKTISLTGGELLVARVLTFDAAALDDNVVIDPGGASNAFHVNGAGVAKFKGLTIAHAMQAILADFNGDLELTDSLLENNGFGIVSNGGMLVVNSTIRGSTGVAVSGLFSSGLTLTDSFIVDNKGGGIVTVQGTLTMTRSSVSGNTGDGVTATASPVKLYQSTISDNGGHGITTPMGNTSILVSDSTIANNSGAGVFMKDTGLLTVTNSTVSGNHARGISGSGQHVSTIIIRYSTITGNEGNRGAGVYSRYNDIKAFNSIISGNTDATGVEHDVSASHTHLYFSLVSRTNPGRTPPVNHGGSIIGTNANPIDPLLGPLANNGGPTLTRMLQPGSVAINAGDPTLAPGGSPTPTFDQRGEGFGRITGGRIDMGSVETGSIANISPTITSPDSVTVPENSTIALTVTAEDPDSLPEARIFTITGGADAAKFQISNAGVLSFVTPPNFEIPNDAGGDHIYNVNIRIEDGVGGFDTQSISIGVTPVNDNSPSFASPSAVNVPENTTLVLPVTATDADLPQQMITFAIIGGEDAARFAISPTGTLSFIQPPKFNAPTDANGDNVYVVTVQANDGQGGTTPQTIRVSITSASARDYGDAPDLGPGTAPGNYQTLASDNGPSHSIVPGLRLGAAVDGLEGGALSNATANADDVNGGLPDDEDGVVAPATDLVLTVGTSPTVTLRVTNTTASTATLSGWIDYNGNGVFENSTERAAIAVPGGTVNGLVTLTFPFVPMESAEHTYARFRLSSDAVAVFPTGPANGGEVEDYRATILRPSVGLSDAAKARKIADGVGGGPPLANFDQFGDSVAALGDLDGDGVADLAVGAMRDQTGGYNRGAVHILFLNADGTVKSRQKIASGAGGLNLNDDDRFGRSVAALGDLDGDGVVDLAVGADHDDTGGANRGAVYIVFLNANGTAKSVKKIASNTGGGPALANNDYFGIAAAALGDLDGDGLSDLAVGAFQDDTGGANRGAAYVLFLNADGSVKASQKIAHGTGGLTLADNDLFGRSLASPGDLDGDGVSDLAVGNVRDDAGGTDRGAVYVLFLNSNGTVKSNQRIASGIGGGPALADGDQFGFALGALGDVNGDGVADLAVGANYDDAGGANRGALYLLALNANGTVQTSTKIASGTGGGPVLADGDYFGTSVAALGDVDEDGLLDLAVGAEFDATGGAARGAVYTLFLQAFALPGDFDGNGLVDSGDLGVWRSHFGASGGPGPIAGDADGDRDVDGADFLAWQRNLGRSAAVSTGAAAQAALLESPTLDERAEPDGTSSLASADSPTSVAWLAAAMQRPKEGAALNESSSPKMRHRAELLQQRAGPAPIHAQAGGFAQVVETYGKAAAPRPSIDRETSAPYDNLATLDELFGRMAFLRGKGD